MGGYSKPSNCPEWTAQVFMPQPYDETNRAERHIGVCGNLSDQLQDMQSATHRIDWLRASVAAAMLFGVFAFWAWAGYKLVGLAL